MDTNKVIDPTQALDMFFRIVREEAAANPVFGRRMVEALGYTVLYRGEDAAMVVDPVLVAMQGLQEFRATFEAMKPEAIQKIGESHGLLQKPTRSPKGIKTVKPTQSELIARLWDRAQQRKLDLFPQLRQAAE